MSTATEKDYNEQLSIIEETSHKELIWFLSGD